MYIFVFIAIINMNLQGINVKPWHFIAYTSTLCVSVYDERMNRTFLIKTSREVLFEVFLRIKLNGLYLEKASVDLQVRFLLQLLSFIILNIRT